MEGGGSSAKQKGGEAAPLRTLASLLRPGCGGLGRRRHRGGGLVAQPAEGRAGIGPREDLLAERRGGEGLGEHTVRVAA